MGQPMAHFPEDGLAPHSFGSPSANLRPSLQDDGINDQPSSSRSGREPVSRLNRGMSSQNGIPPYAQDTHVVSHSSPAGSLTSRAFAYLHISPSFSPVSPPLVADQSAAYAPTAPFLAPTSNPASNDGLENGSLVPSSAAAGVYGENNVSRPRPTYPSTPSTYRATSPRRFPGLQPRPSSTATSYPPASPASVMYNQIRPSRTQDRQAEEWRPPLIWPRSPPLRIGTPSEYRDDVSDDDAYLLTEPNRRVHRISDDHERRRDEHDYERQEQRVHHASIAHDARMAIMSLERILPAALDETTD
jgi:hypothetical protein